MKSVLIALLLSILLIFSSGMTSYAQDFEKGLRAYKSGDFTAALTEWMPLAEQGKVGAQNNLALMYSKGQGVAQDHEEAAKWFLKAAEQGYADAQYNLASLYATGQGVIQNDLDAHMWWSIAAANGDDDAAYNRGVLEKKMSSSQISEAQKLARECVAKEYEGC